MSYLLQYYHTLKYVKFIQIKYQLFYRLRKNYRKYINFSYPIRRHGSVANDLILTMSICSNVLFHHYLDKKKFIFLNQSHTFDKEIDWNYAGLGKLWTYNLNYFEYLLQQNMNREEGVTLINDFIKKIDQIKDGLEPFPIALRGINWIKFLSQHSIRNKNIDDSLYAQYYILMDNLEYHLLGNHLLENGFSLLFGAYYFQDQKLFDQAKEILFSELHEQILSDGAHFELTPMYHQIMLFRVLDCYNLMAHNNVFEDTKLQNLLKEKAEIMLGWLENIMYQNGSVPHFNDSTENIAPAPQSLLEYAKRLELRSSKVPMYESGYRKCVTDCYELVIDAGNIGPDYIPGHAHSDTANFELHIDQLPVVIDTGISTYEANERRKLERSTKAHNTVEIDEIDQSEVWSSFRVARRAKVIDRDESKNYIRVTHDGYSRIGAIHSREFYCKEKEIKIIDTVTSKGCRKYRCCAYLHFSPDIKIEDIIENAIVTKDAIFTFEGLKKLELVDITIAKGYNKLIKSKAAKIFFEHKLLTLINVIEPTK